MTFEFGKIVESKRALRARLAALPIGEKLRMLDALRERTLSIRAAKLEKPSPAEGGTDINPQSAG